jgi:hypothetical protein
MDKEKKIFSVETLFGYDTVSRSSMEWNEIEGYPSSYSLLKSA